MLEQESQLLQSPNDKKSYRRVKLPNGLTCLLIHDPEIELSEGQDDSEFGSSDSSKGEPSDCEEEDNGEEEEEDDDDEELSEAGDDEAEGTVKKAAVAMAVGVGSYSDPLEIPGLSHYLEHMLFMGSEKFPDENEYEAYLTKHGGYSNAFTEQEHTVYHFDVNPKFLHGALDRFAQFFVAPLCKEDSLEREVEAVENEFTCCLQDDYCRGYELMCHTAKPAHPYRNFSWGNKKSLWDDPKAQGVDIRKELMKYYRSQYGAERMSLVVLGGEPLDTLEEWVRELLGVVPCGVGPITNFCAHGYPFEGQNMYVISSVKDDHSVTVTFQLPPLGKMYKKKAEDYISHLLGHEGPGSLLSALKEKRWAVECEAGIDESGDSMNTFVYIFEVTLTLTDAGLEAAPGFGLAPILMVFQYLKMLQNEQPQKWVFEEMKATGEMKFRFLEESDAANYVTQLCTAPFHVAPEHTLISSYLYEDWDPNLVSDLLKKMVPTAPGLRIDVKSKKAWEMHTKLLETCEGAKIQHEPWFNFDYISLPLSEDIKRSWIDAPVPEELKLPPRNPYIPKDFALKSSVTANGEAMDITCAQKKTHESASSGGTPLVPDLICDESGLRAWHKLDQTYQSPKINVFIRVYSPAAYDTPRNVARLQMMLALWEESLNEELYLADVAGLHTGFYPKGASGFELRISGFSDKLPLLVIRIVEHLSKFEANEQSFSILHEVMVRKYENRNMSVEKHSNYLRIYALSDGAWDYTEVLAELRNIKLQDVEEYVSLLLEGIHVEVLVHGNADKNEALRLSRDIRKGFGPGVLEADARKVVKCTDLAAGSRYVHRADAKNPEERNSSMELYFQFGPMSVKQKALADLVDQMLLEPCFNVLRTIEQLGYGVSCSSKLSYGVMGLSFSIVSEKYAPFHLENRVDAFLQQFEEMLKDMSDKEFNEHREALISDNLQKDRNLAQASSHLWEHISSERYEFDSRRVQALELQKLSKKEVQDWYYKHMSPSSTARRMLVVNVICKPHCSAEAEANPPQSILSTVQVPNIQELRKNLPKFPAMTRELSSVSGIQKTFARAVLNPKGSLGRVLRFR